MVEFCINTPWPTYEIAHKMLSYAESRVGFDMCGQPCNRSKHNSSVKTFVTNLAYAIDIWTAIQLIIWLAHSRSQAEMLHPLPLFLTRIQHLLQW